jgi:large subunit ribosomal protein L25
VSGAITEEQLEAELAESEAELGIEHDPTDAEQAAEADAAAEGADDDAASADEAPASTE